MPCYEPRSSSNSSNCELERELKEITSSNDYLIGAICAIDNELVSLGIAESVYAKAQRHGLIDILSIIELHRQEDTVRLHKDIMSRYSKHELEVIKKLLETTK